MIEDMYTQVPIVEEDDNTTVIIIGASAGAGAVVLIGFILLVGVVCRYVRRENSYWTILTSLLNIRTT